jgi:UDP-N-acetylmuramoyl-L-alanyl-D-glutamate--2,6-diaminopimelate ligase
MIKFIKAQKSKLAAVTNGNPSSKLKLIGVTGTRGKTTTTHMLYQILLNAGIKAGFISTLGYSIEPGVTLKDSYSNTMDAITLNKILKQMLSKEITHVVVEVNSSGLANKVFEGITFDSGIVTNIFLDRPETYDTWENYAKTKIDFLSKVKNGGLVVLGNHNAEVSNWVIQEAGKIKNNIFSYWIDGSTFKDLIYSNNKMNFKVEDEDFEVPFIGSGNLYNSLMSAKLAELYVPSHTISKSLSTHKTVDGRMEVVVTQPFMVIVDYAYTPDMLEEALKYISLVKPYNAKIITVVGSSGSKNKDRRVIAATAANYSGLVILAAEDPRSERVSDINTELHLRAQESRAILVERISSQEEYGWLNKDNLKSKIERVKSNNDIPFVAFDAEDFTSRLNAIDFAIKCANPGDVILIAGKGDDNTLSFSHADYEWSDSEAVKQAMSANFVK